MKNGERFDIFFVACTATGRISRTSAIKRRPPVKKNVKTVLDLRPV